MLGTLSLSSHINVQIRQLNWRRQTAVQLVTLSAAAAAAAANV